MTSVQSNTEYGYNTTTIQMGFSLLEFVLLISKVENHPFNEMVNKPLFNILSLPLLLARQLSIARRMMLTL